MKRRAGRNYAAEPEQLPDCCTCAYRRECERYAENSYCTRWCSRKPEENPERKPEEDPNRKWRTGEEVEF